jgi:hypothetical protein
MRHFQMLGHEVISLLSFTGLIASHWSERNPATVNARANRGKRRNLQGSDIQVSIREAIIDFNARWMNAMTPVDFI